MPKMRDQSRTQFAAGPAARHLHRFEVETDTDAVQLSIGRPEAEATAGQESQAAHANVPGGYLKVFNRLIDSGAWATLPDAARAVYLPLARFADAREGFRTRAGLAALMKHTGLSRSSVKRGLKSLQEARLLTVVRVGGVAADGTNRTNVYQLLVPDDDDAADGGPVRGGKPVAEPPARRSVQSAARAKRAAKKPAEELPGVHARTPSRFTAEPPAGSAADPRRGSPADPAAGPPAAGTGVNGGPLYRPTSSESISLPAAAANVVGESDWQEPEKLARSAQSLQRWGVSPAAARELAARHGPDAVRSAVAAVEPLARQGKLRNAAGFLVSRLEQGWSDGPSAAPSTAGLEERTRAERERREAEAASALAARGSADAEVDALDDATLDALAARVLAAHAGRPAMVRLLTAKPPRQSRLMRAEVAALLEV